AVYCGPGALYSVLWSGKRRVSALSGPQNGISPRSAGVAGANDQFGHLVVGRPIGRRDSRQAVDVAVEHAERSRDQNGVVDLPIGGAFGPSDRDDVVGDGSAALLHLPRQAEQRPHLGRDGSGVEVGESGVDNVVSAVELLRREGAV